MTTKIEIAIVEKRIDVTKLITAVNRAHNGPQSKFGMLPALVENFIPRLAAKWHYKRGISNLKKGCICNYGVDNQYLPGTGENEYSFSRGVLQPHFEEIVNYDKKAICLLERAVLLNPLAKNYSISLAKALGELGDAYYFKGENDNAWNTYSYAANVESSLQMPEMAKLRLIRLDNPLYRF